MLLFESRGPAIAEGNPTLHHRASAPRGGNLGAHQTVSDGERPDGVDECLHGNNTDQCWRDVETLQAQPQSNPAGQLLLHDCAPERLTCRGTCFRIACDEQIETAAPTCVLPHSLRFHK